MDAIDPGNRIAADPKQWTWRTLLAWLTPFALILLARLLPQEPSAPANVFGQTGPRQTATMVAVISILPLHLLLSYFLVRRWLWLLFAWILTVVLLLLISEIFAPGSTEGMISASMVIVLAPLLGYVLSLAVSRKAPKNDQGRAH